MNCGHGLFLGMVRSPHHLSSNILLLISVQKRMLRIIKTPLCFLAATCFVRLVRSPFWTAMIHVYAHWRMYIILTHCLWRALKISFALVNAKFGCIVIEPHHTISRTADLQVGLIVFIIMLANSILILKLIAIITGWNFWHFDDCYCWLIFS